MSLTVIVAYAAPDCQAIVPVTVPDGATVADAVAASDLVARLGLPAGIGFAIYGQRARAETPLCDGDRVELTRPLTADAKSIRHARAADNPLPKTTRVKRPRG